MVVTELVRIRGAMLEFGQRRRDSGAPNASPSLRNHTDLVRQTGREYSLAPEGIDAETDVDRALGVPARG